MTKQLNRRIFLRGLGGAVVAAPFLGSIAEKRVKAQAAAPQPTLIAMFSHYGTVTNKFFPTKSNGALTADDLTGTSLAALTPYVDNLLIVRGMRAMNEWTSTLKRGQGNDPHLQVVGSYFTCQPVTPNTDNPFDFDNATKFNAMPVGPSLDHVMAQQISPNGTPMFMRVGNASDSAQSAISYSAATTAYPGLGTPTQAFSGLTGLFGAGTPMNADTYAAVKGQSVIDLVKDDLATLERFNMSMDDHNKLEAWKALLDDTGTVVASAQCSQATSDALGATTANVAAASKGGLGTDVLGAQITSTLDGADIYSAVAVLAAVCNANPVIFLKYPPSYVYKSLGLTTENHSLSHRIGNAGMTGTCVTGVVDMLVKIDTYLATKFANLVGMLKSINSNGGTLLDNTAAIWFNEMSDGNAHNLNNLPVIQAGSAGGYFKQGWTVNVEDGSASLSLGNSLSACEPGTPTTVDGTTQSTGTDPTVSNAPINKYFYNIMNALGVKADATGFPAKGGTAPVTKFGFSDSTADFIHGTTNTAATIHNPGEYSQLKAGSS
jgi:Protein of unknown function (DUF1552)